MTSMMIKTDDAYNPLDLAELVIMDRDWVFDRPADSELIAEVSGVCTHPDFRGRGLASSLMRMVAERIVARGDVPFLHTYADNAVAIAMYEGLGFRFRKELLLRVLA